MNGELVKRQDRWDLYAEDGSKIGSSAPNPMNKLSIKNCQAIENGYDLDELAVLSTKDETTIVGNQKMAQGFIKGFNKAMELNKDKLFTVEDVRKAMSIGLSIGYGRQFEIENKSVEIDSYIKSLQQPTEIEVEIEMEKVVDETKMIGVVKGVKGSGNKITTYKSVPKLDENGCLILKKKE